MSEQNKSGPSGKACEVILYPADGWTKDKIVAEIVKRGSVELYAIILHDSDYEPDGTPKDPHYHVYLSFGNTKWFFSDIADWFGTDINKVEHIKAKGRNARYHYLLYQLHAKQPEKHQYEVSDITANFDVAGYIKAHDQNVRLSEILDLIADGTITRSNYPNYMDIHTYSRNKTKLERAWEYRDLQQSQKSYGERIITVIWIAGKSRTGKTTLVKIIAKQDGEALYITEEGAHPFDGYVSQRLVLIDELRPNDPYTFTQLLQLLDNHTARAIGARYHNKIPNFDTVFVTSIHSPAEFFRLCKANSEDAVQLYRRITEYWDVAENTITIHRYNFDNKRFEVETIRPNPVPAYLETVQKPIMFNSESVLDALESRYMDKQMSIDFDTEISFIELDDDNKNNPFNKE